MRDSMKFLVIIIILAFISTISTAYSQEESTAESVTELKEINFQIVEADKIEFTVVVDGEFRYEYFRTSDPPQLAIDLFPIQKISVGPYVDIGIIRIIGMRVGFFQPQVVRIVFELAERIPNYRVTSVEGGIKIALWIEEVIPEEEKPPEVEEVEAEKDKTPEEAPEVVKEKIIPRAPKILEHNYFIQGAFGVGVHASPTFKGQSTFTLYGEEGSLDENYKLKTSLLFDLNIGRFFWIKNTLVKGNLNLSYLTFKNEGSFQVTLPHPFLPESPRNYTFDDSLKGNLFNISVSPLFSVLKRKKYEVWLGPVIGFSFGKVNILEDISMEEQSPFTSADINVKAKAYLEEKISSLWAGGVETFEYKVARNLSLVLDVKYFFLSPKSKTLNTKISLSQLQFAVGILYYFF